MIGRARNGRAGAHARAGRSARRVLLPVVLLAALAAGPAWAAPPAAAAPSEAWPVMPTEPTAETGPECPPATPPVGQPPRTAGPSEVVRAWHPNYPVAAVEGTKLHVALGDSYASGEGAAYPVEDRCGGLRRAYIEGTATEGNHCHRSLSAYPYQLWALLEEDDPSWRLDQRACSGANTHHFAEAQTDFFGRGDGPPGNPAQLPRGEVLRADLVTITMAGNDAGFGSIVRDCLVNIYVGSVAPWCSPVRDPLVAHQLDGIWERYRESFERIESPRVLMAGYPLPFPMDDRMPDSCGFGSGRTLGASDMRWLNSVAVRANDELRAIAAEQGAAFVEVGDLLQSGDHTMCEDVAGPDVGERWINRFIPSSMEASAHPNAYLHRAEAERMERCLETWDRPSARPYYCRVPPNGPTF